MKKWHIFFIVWVSWAWKWTVINSILKEKIIPIEFVKSVKTRELRAWEIDWVDYIKKTKKEFEDMIKASKLLEYNFVHKQNYYWTRKKDIFENGIDKWKILLKEIDILILPKLLETLKEKRKYFSFIFLDLPETEVRNRILKRWEKTSEEDIKNRIESAKKEVSDFMLSKLK